MSDLQAIHAEFYRSLSAIQGHRCGICGCYDPGRLVRDHDHRTGFVRGLLCHSCNIAEAKHSCGGQSFECMYCEWSERPAVTWLGWTVEYISQFAPRHGEYRPTVDRVLEHTSVRRRLGRRCVQLMREMSATGARLSIEAHLRRSGELAAERRAS